MSPISRGSQLTYLFNWTLGYLAEMLVSMGPLPRGGFGLHGQVVRGGPRQDRLFHEFLSAGLMSGLVKLFLAGKSYLRC